VVFDFVGCKQHNLNLSYNKIKWKLAQVTKNNIYMYHVKEITQWMQSIHRVISFTWYIYGYIFQNNIIRIKGAKVPLW
jgi:hypothetical protein